MQLSPGERLRYQRHLDLPEVGVEGQTRLKNASVLVIGAGGIGSPASLYLAAAGVGRIGIVDDDRVDVSNLQRQILHSSRDVGFAKVTSAKNRLLELNSEIRVETYPFRLTIENAREIICNYDIVIDGTDNFKTRFLINDVCVLSVSRTFTDRSFVLMRKSAFLPPKMGPVIDACIPSILPDRQVRAVARQVYWAYFPG